MKKTLFCLVLISLLMVSCITPFDVSSLQPNDYSLSNKLPNLIILSDDTTTSVGSSDSVSTSSYLYTVFRRELTKNILDTSMEEKGSIEMVLTYHNVDFIRPQGVRMEFEINIKNKEDKVIWNNTYYDKEEGKIHEDINSFFTIIPSADDVQTLTVRLEHRLLDRFKDDVSRDYKKIIEQLK